MAKPDEDDKAPTIIIKKVKKVSGGHHGGAWKVAYADFVTAMMAFFLLLWLLNVTTAEQKQGLADYFSPSVVSSFGSGAGGVMGGTTISKEGAMTSTSSSAVIENTAPAALEKDKGEGKDEAELDKMDEKSFAQTEEMLLEEINSNPELKAFSENLMIDMTPEGLRIQIVDKKGRPMFEIGKATPLPQTVKLLKIITNVILELPNKVSIRGHTDSRPYGKDADYTNWELSSDRANASRRVMKTAELEDYRVQSVQGKADREHLDEADPNSDRNRRITIMVLKQSVVKADTKAMKEFKKRRKTKQQPKPIEHKKREKGIIYFP